MKNMIQEFFDKLIKFGHSLKEVVKMTREYFADYKIRFKGREVIDVTYVE